MGIGCWCSHQRDRARLRRAALSVADAQASRAEQVLALLHWVHRNGDTAKNEEFFAFRRLGATAVQVLDRGGDCADKSRLLTSLLREAGIPASVALCFDARSGFPAHTLVEARTGPDTYMLVDPAFDLYFPKPDNAGYYDLLDLRRDPGIVTRRVAALRSQRPPGPSALPYYLRASASYGTASTINWNKNAALRWLHDRLRSILGENVDRLPRPVLMEEPKLALATLGFVIGALVALGLAWRRRRSMVSSRSQRAAAASDVARAGRARLSDVTNALESSMQPVDKQSVDYRKLPPTCAPGP